LASIPHPSMDITSSADIPSLKWVIVIHTPDDAVRFREPIALFSSIFR
jgi:hypothetical protein